jgi:hypothetical protein
MVARAFFLNFDAEAELADPSARTPSRAVAERSRALAQQVRGLLEPGDVVLMDQTRLHGGPFEGRAWCPTPRALDALARAGAVVPRAPPLPVLQRVNHRRFCAELGLSLPGARWVTTREELSETISPPSPPSPTGLWLLRRPFGFAGRGRLRLAPARVGAAEERWIQASLAGGEGILAEPWVERDADFGLHGHITEGGVIALGEPTSQRCDARGAWISSERAARGELSAEEERALFAATEEAAAALAGAGYFGPFGVDAFRYRDARGGLAFNQRCEINARYSMGWAVGMGALRPDL